MAVAEVPLFVIDATVILRWHFPTDASGRKALDVLADFRAGRINLIGPPDFPEDVHDAISQRVLLEQVDLEAARRASGTFDGLGIPTVSRVGMVSEAFKAAVRWDLYLNDGMYVALALLESCPLLTSDGRLIRALHATPVNVLRLEDYRSPQA